MERTQADAAQYQATATAESATRKAECVKLKEELRSLRERSDELEKSVGTMMSVYKSAMYLHLRRVFEHMRKIWERCMGDSFAWSDDFDERCQQRQQIASMNSSTSDRRDFILELYQEYYQLSREQIHVGEEEKLSEKDLELATELLDAVE